MDWIENSVLWSDAENGTIWRVDTDGRNKKTVLQDLSQPSSVVVDPNERYKNDVYLKEEPKQLYSMKISTFKINGTSCFYYNE